MNMKKTVCRYETLRGLALAGMTALTAAAAVAAEDDEQAEPAAEARPAATNAVPANAFTALPLCRRVVGHASVRIPGGDWAEAEEGKFYPFGTSYRAEPEGQLVLALGSGSTVTIADGSEFGTRNQAVGLASRTIVLTRGKIELKLADNLPDGALFVVAPGFTVKNPAGESVITYEDLGDGDAVTLRCGGAGAMGSMGVEGRHFDIPVMHSANELTIRTSRDQLFTALYGKSGDVLVNLDQGMCLRDEFGDDGQLKHVVEKGVLAWHLFPRTKVVINRAVPSVGERMSVHTMTFDAAGVLQNERCFSEGRAEVNTGELVIKATAKGEDIAKRAAEVTETKAGSDEGGEAEKTESEEQTSNEG